MKKSSNKKGRNSTSEPKQSRTFTMLVYPEWSFLNDILTHIRKEKYALILHNKDVEEDTGEIKKPHIHIVFQYGGRRTLTAVQNEYKKIGVEDRFIDTCNERVMIRYLIHKDHPDKYQYDKKLIDTNMRDVVELALTDTVTSDTGFYRLNKYINDSKEYITQSAINEYAFKNGLLKGLKTYGYQISAARIEHNQAYLTNKKVSDLVDREKVKEHVKVHNRYKQAEKLVDEFGTITIEDNGKTYTLTNAKVGTDRSVNLDVWEGLELTENTSGRITNGEDNNGKK